MQKLQTDTLESSALETEATPSGSGAAATIDLDQRSVNAIRFLAADGVEKAGSGHPGMPMGAAPMAYALWARHLRHNPQDPGWWNRDRFVLSAGHGSMLLYALLYLTGYEDVSLEELQRFRQWKSKTPGHPENFVTRGVETTTGPLGQGFANGVGMAIAERFLAARFNRAGFPLFDHYTYAIVSDGDLMEGISHEAASLAGHLGLGRLIYLYDDNQISIDGSTALSFTEDVYARFEAYGWHVERVEDGHDVEAIDAALARAREALDRPSLIGVRTTIGYGSPGKAGSAAAHGEPLGAEELRRAKRNLEWPDEPAFFVPEDVLAHMRRARERGVAEQAAWAERLARYAEAHPTEAAELGAHLSGELPADLDALVPVFEAGSRMATRAASGKVLDALVPRLGNLLGGSADLTPSNKTRARTHADFQRETPGGGYLRFGVREHAMAAICNGIALHGGIRAYCATFFVFSDYLRPALRLSALMRLPVVYVFTHDSIGLGEDGPTHQPVEHLMALRTIPNVTLIRPADANETVEAWRFALRHTSGPVLLVLSRQDVPTLERSEAAPASLLRKGGYVLSECEGTPELILIGTGSELQHALAAAETLRAEGVRVRVVSMPSWELFEAQPREYRDAVLPPELKRRLTIEAGTTFGWERYCGPEGRRIGLDRFGASAPAEVLMENFGFTAENVLREARALLGS